MRDHITTNIPSEDIFEKDFGTDPENLLPLTLKLSNFVRLLASIRDPVISLLDKSRNLRFDSLANESIGPAKSLLFNLTSKNGVSDQSSFTRNNIMIY